MNEDAPMSGSYAEDYSESSFWDKARDAFKSAGQQTLFIALKLYYSARDPDTPTWAKTTIYSALGYFICTMDAIPDLTPILGFSDDLGALTVAMATVAAHVKDVHTKKAKEKVEDWFPSSEHDRNYSAD